MMLPCCLRHIAISSRAASLSRPHIPLQVHCLWKSIGITRPSQQSYKVKADHDRQPVEVWEGMTVRQLAISAKREPIQILKAVNYCLVNEKTAKMDSKIEDKDFIVSLTKLLGLKPLFKAQQKSVEIDKDVYPRPPPDPAICTPRPAVVTILGHVDHGKTTLLDALRSSRLVDEEYGGITQHLAAFCLPINALIHATSTGDSGNSLSDSQNSGYITFLDTPGHAAFSAIRARGASITDMVVLVVAADDGVMPQTVECIRFAKEAHTPIVVAINKVDKFGVNVTQVMEDLSMHGVLVEQLGGDVQAVEISALKKMNLLGLLDAILLQAELMQLKADATGPVEAYVLEVETEHGLGKVATCLVTRGQLRKTPASGPLVANEAICSPRFLFNDLGQQVPTVYPGYVAKVVGWRDFPAAGSQLLEVKSLAQASEVIRYRRNRRLQEKAASDHAAYTARMAPYRTHYAAHLEERMKAPRHAWRDIRKRRPDFQLLMEENSVNLPKVTLIIKADVQGSLEAIQSLLATCPTDECVIDIAHAAVGPLTESEVENASAVGGSIILFNIPSLPSATTLAESKGVVVKQYTIIYRLAEDVRDLISARLPPMYEEQVIGEAEILKLFSVKEPRVGGGRPIVLPVAGCRCTRGQLLAQQPKVAENGPFGCVVNMYYCVTRLLNTGAQPIVEDTSGEELLSDSNPLINQYTTICSQVYCHSLRHERTAVESIKRGAECGISLVTGDGTNSRLRSSEADSSYVSNWQVGDVIRCCVTVKKSRTFDWTFEGKPTSAGE